MNYSDLISALAPEAIVVLTALAVLAVDLLGLRHASLDRRQSVAAGISAAGIALAIASLSSAPVSPRWLEGYLANSPTSAFIKQVTLALAGLTGLLSLRSRFTQHTGEFFTLLLLSSVGMMLLASADNLLILFVALELTSLPLYTLTAFDKRSTASSEAGLKYFLIGSLSAAFLLFGISLLYGLSGSLALSQVAIALGTKPEPIVYVALAMTLLGFGFKVAAAPFHLWAPDVYQGAPTPVAAFIASGSKVASFFVFGRICLTALSGSAGSAAWGGASPGWVPMLAGIAALSMVLGNVAALLQSNVKRLLAYSAVGHAGYALLAIITNTQQGLGALSYYAITYAITALGAFAVVNIVERQSDASGTGSLEDFAGLGRRAPGLSLCMLVFILSLAGIPPLAGFFGKFLVFLSTARSGTSTGLLWLVIVAIGCSAISLYYYLQILKRIYVSEPASTTASRPLNPDTTASFQLHTVEAACLAVLAAAVVLFGCAPNWLVRHCSPTAAPLNRAVVMPLPLPSQNPVAWVHVETRRDSAVSGATAPDIRTDSQAVATSREGLGLANSKAVTRIP